jgi:nitroreductase/NAD-dependent dihydropyrimidine dehydrogenase PreA subunit
MAWDEVKDVLRPQSVQMGVMEVDTDVCTSCELCLQNCPFKCWEMGEDEFPKLKEGYACFSCFNCMVVCESDAISIAEVYHVKDGFWKTEPHPIPVKEPLRPKDKDGNPAEWTTVERAILERRSVRNYTDQPVSDHLIRRVLEAGRFAPTSGNCQPWQFVVITDKKIIDDIDEALHPGMKGYYDLYCDDEMVKGMEDMVKQAMPRPSVDPRLMRGGFGVWASKEMLPSLGAPAVILIAADERAIGGPDIQIGICGQNMSLAANSMEIKSCWSGIYAMIESMPDLKAKLGLAAPFKIISGLVLGYPEFKQEGLVPREFRPIKWFRNGLDNMEVED